jgi:sigma-B regulation protein RsbU (phosphoserine phosphatase)
MTRPHGAPDSDGELGFEQLRRLQRVTDVALAHLSVGDLLDELLIRVREVLSADTAAVLLLDQATNELVATAANGLEEEVEQGVRIPLGKGFAGRIAAERNAIVIGRVNHSNVLNPILREKGVRSLIGAPLIAQGEVLGVLHAGTLTERVFSQGDIELLQLVADRMALALHVRLYEQERLVAATLQRSLLPEVLPTAPGIRMSSRYVPASSVAGVGGDWYDAFLLPDGRLALAIGDVAGHGLFAASVMGRVRNALRGFAIDGGPPGDVAARLDRLVNHFDPGNLITLLYGVLDLDMDLRAFRFVSAGHLPPLVVSPSGAAYVESDDTRNQPLGARHPRAFEEQCIALDPGSHVLLYTDGLVERKEESLTAGLERLRSAASLHLGGALTLDDAVTGIIRDVASGDQPLDDVAVLLVRREQPAPNPANQE